LVLLRQPFNTPQQVLFFYPERVDFLTMLGGPLLLEGGEASPGGRLGSLLAMMGGPAFNGIHWDNVPGLLAPTPRAMRPDYGVGVVLGVALIAGVGRGRLAWHTSGGRLAAVAAGVALVVFAASIPYLRYLTTPLLFVSHPVNDVYLLAALPMAAAAGALALDDLIDRWTAGERRWERGRLPIIKLLFAAAGILVLLPSDQITDDWTRALYAVGWAGAVVVLPLAWRLPPERLRSGLFGAGIASLGVYAATLHLAAPSAPLHLDRIAEAEHPDLADGYADFVDLANMDDFKYVVTEGEDGLEYPFDGEFLPYVEFVEMTQAIVGGRQIPLGLAAAHGHRALAGEHKLTPIRQSQALHPLLAVLPRDAPPTDADVRRIVTPESPAARVLALHGLPWAAGPNEIVPVPGPIAPACYSPAFTEVIADPRPRMARILAFRFDPAGPALLESGVPAEGLVRARVDCSKSGLIEADASGGPALVVVRERFHRGWRVIDGDGRRLAPVPVNQVHFGVFVERGTHLLDVSFHPPGLAPAAGFATVAWLILLGLMAPGRQARHSLVGLLALVCVSCAAPEPDSLPAGFEFAEEGGARGLVPPDGDEDGEWPLFGGGGLAAEDLDGDGDIDLLVADLVRGPAVWANDGDGNFSWGGRLSLPPGDDAFFAVGLAAADLDDDLLPEVLISGAGFVAIARNLGGMEFADPEPLSLTVGVCPTFSLADADGDGRLDLALGCNSLDVQERLVVGPAPDLLLLGLDAPGPPWFGPPQSLVAGPDGSRILAMTFTDVDGDGDMDLFAPGDLGPPSALWRNEGVQDGLPVFVDDAPFLGADLSISAMGIDSWDANGDGRLDYCITDGEPPQCLVSGPDGRYTESGAQLGLEPADGAPTVGWAFEFADLDNDGELDAIQASGPEPFENRAGFVDLVWRGEAPDRFVDVTADSGAFGDPGDHHGLAVADFDGDGCLDLLTAGPTPPIRYYAGECPEGSWLEVELRGAPGNTPGFGALIELTVGGRTTISEVSSLRGEGQSPTREHFGLGTAETVDRLRVVWPDGAVTELLDVPGGALIHLDHPDVP